MAKERIAAAYNDVPFAGTVTVYTQEDGSYVWKVDNKTFQVRDIHNVTETEIANPYYSEAITIAATDNSIVVVQHNPPRAASETYRLWNYASIDQIPSGDKSTTPWSVNYGGIDLVRRLHKRSWLHHGLIVQVVYYADFLSKGSIVTVQEEIALTDENIADYYGSTVVADEQELNAGSHGLYVDTTQLLDISTPRSTDVWETPVVRERWHWTLDSATNFATYRNIHIEWYRDRLDLSDPENPKSVILPPTKEYQKYYPDTVSKVREIQRRRKNVISALEESVIGMIAYTATAGNIAQAIALGQAFMTDINSLISDFVEHGDDDLANMVASQDIRDAHTWLSNDLAVLGMPGIQIYQTMYSELTVDISDAIEVFDFNSLPNY